MNALKDLSIVKTILENYKAMSIWDWLIFAGHFIVPFAGVYSVSNDLTSAIEAGLGIAAAGMVNHFRSSPRDKKAKKPQPTNNNGDAGDTTVDETL